jgi:hypothetical protein
MLATEPRIKQLTTSLTMLLLWAKQRCLLPKHRVCSDLLDPGVRHLFNKSYTLGLSRNNLLRLHN